MAKCMQCSEYYESKRSTSLYCSVACRVKAHRNANEEIARVCNAKRGKDIRCFDDLPLDVQKTIDMMSTKDDGTIDESVKANRTAIAIDYQHRHQGSYYPEDAVCSGVITGKPGDSDYNGICTEAWRKAYGG